MVMTRVHAHAINQGQLVQTIEWKQTDGQADTTDLITFFADTVGELKKIAVVPILARTTYPNTGYLIKLRIVANGSFMN